LGIEYGLYGFAYFGIGMVAFIAFNMQYGLWKGMRKQLKGKVEDEVEMMPLNRERR